MACQIDALCKLSTDRARLKALNTLPTGLCSTYERVVDRINERGPDAKKVVKPTLQWTVGSFPPLSMPQLIEAIAVEDCDNRFDKYAKVKERDIIRWCSCLVRPSQHTKALEIAHFTVEEFLNSIDASMKPSHAFLKGLRHEIHAKLAYTCLKYLLFDDFAHTDVIAFSGMTTSLFGHMQRSVGRIITQ